MKKEKAIYILLTDTGSFLAKMIQYCTGEQLSHVSIAFDSELSEVYSFGRRYQENPLIGGFVREDLRGPLFTQSPCALYRLSVDECTYDRIRIQVEHFIQHEAQYRYNFLGMFAVFFRYNWERENHYFCSQFVATVLKNADLPLIGKSPALTTPADFQYAELDMIYKGELHHYMGSMQALHRAIEKFQTA